jgi:hypothetical protein
LNKRSCITKRNTKNTSTKFAQLVEYESGGVEQVRERRLRALVAHAPSQRWQALAQCLYDTTE